MAIPTVNYKSVEDKPLAWDSPGLLIFRFIAPDRDWNDRSELSLIAKAFENLSNNIFSMYFDSFLLVMHISVCASSFFLSTALSVIFGRMIKYPKKQI